MGKKDQLTPKQARFVAEYLVDLNGAQAAIRAGYNPKRAKETACELVTKSNISGAISEGKTKQLEKADLTAVRVLEEYRRLAFLDARSFWDAKGNLKPIGELTAEQGSALSSFEVVIKNAAAGDGHTDIIHKLKLWDKTRALESLAKHFGLLVDKLEVTGGLDITWKDSE
jgi:phage terminase small subunit